MVCYAADSATLCHKDIKVVMVYIAYSGYFFFYLMSLVPMPSATVKLKGLRTRL